MIDVELYGGYRACLTHVRARALHAFGAYARGAAVDWRSVERLVFVCKGNICRSPYAGEKARLLGLLAVSFGLEALEGACAEPAAVRNALVRGVDLSTHRSLRLEGGRLLAGDLVLVFEPAQMRVVRRQFGGARIGLAGTWTRPLRPHIQDPYGHGDRYFQQCFAVIDAQVEAIAQLMKEVKRAHSPEALCTPSPQIGRAGSGTE